MAITDASFSNNEDLSSQVGHIVMLSDDTERGNILSYMSSKSMRVVRSVVGAKTHAFADCFDAVYALRDNLLRIRRGNKPIALLTDSACLYNIIAKWSRTSVRRTTIVFIAPREAYNKGEIDDIGWLLTKENTADSITKLEPNAALGSSMKTGRLEQSASQWIIRSKSEREYDDMAPASELNELTMNSC